MEENSPCKTFEVASPEPEDGGGSLHALQWGLGLTCLAKLSKSLALRPSMVDLPCKTLEVTSPEPKDGGGGLHILHRGLTYLAKRLRSLALSPRMVVGAFMPSNGW
jgi:hypothetical protein